MSKKKSLKITFFIFFIFIMFEYYNQVIDLIDFVIWFVYYNQYEVIKYILACGSVISAVMLAKKIFWDTRQILKLQKEIGKTGLYNSLRVIHELIKIYDIKETVKRIKMIDKTELQMKKTITEISSTFLKSNELKPEIKLKFKDKFKISKKILEMIKIIDKQLDINKIEENISVSNKRNIKRQPVIDTYVEERKKEWLKTLDKSKFTNI